MNRRLDNWVLPCYLQESTSAKLHHKFHSAKPFPHLELQDFFQERKLVPLIRSLLQEKFQSKENDLFKFSQTADMRSSKNKVVTEFYAFLSSPEFCNLMLKFTQLKLSPGKIDMAGTFYHKGEYLLPHDDQFEGRAIAYFLYLSTLTPTAGGKLQLFSSRNNQPTIVSKEILPRWNTFAFFQVSPRSWHQIEEVTADVQRLAISGWFQDH